jgi:protein-disulfide isomerase
MLSTPTHRNRRQLPSYFYLFIPMAFVLGLGAGYLLWSPKPSPVAANAAGNQRVTVSTDGDPSIGPANAPITIVEFSDYQCPYCQAWYQQTFDKLMASYPGKIRFVYRDLPLPMHPQAIPAAEAANCAGEQGAYWKFHNALFSGQYSLGRTAYVQYASDLGLDAAAFTACLDDHHAQAEVEADVADAARLGLNGTPSFVINGQILVGAQPFEQFKAIIDADLAAKP